MNTPDAVSDCVARLQELYGGSLENPGRLRAKCSFHKGDDFNCQYNIGHRGGESYVYSAKCHSRDCASEDILGELEREGIPTRIKPNLEDDFDSYRVVKEWDYDCVDGKTRRVLRWENRHGDKRISQKGSTKSTPHILEFPPTDIEKLTPVVIVEGETTAEAIQAIGMIGVCWNGGAAYPHRSCWDRIADIYKKTNGLLVLWPDDDEQGRDAMKVVAQILRGIFQDKQELYLVHTDGDTHKDAANYDKPYIEEKVTRSVRLPKIHVEPRKPEDTVGPDGLTGDAKSSRRINPQSDNPPKDLAEFCKSTGDFSLQSNMVHHFETANGLWHKLDDSDTASMVCMRPDYLWRAKLEMERSFNFQVGRIVTGLLKSDIRVPRTHPLNFDLWPFESYVFDVREDIKRDFRKDDFFTRKLGYDVGPADKNPDIYLDEPTLFFKFLETALFDSQEEAESKEGLDKMDAVLQCLSYILFCENFGQLFFSFYGKDGSGKGVLTRLLRSLIGDDYCMNVNQTLMKEGKPWALAGGETKRLMTIEELKTYIDQEAVKQLTGDDKITAAFKGKDSYEFDYRGHLIVTSNSTFSTDSAGMQRRIVAIPFVRSPDKPDPRLINKLMAMREQIWMFLYRAYGKDMVLAGNFLIPQPLKEDKEEFVNADMSPASFARQCIHKGTKGELTTSEITESYIRWAGISDSESDQKKAKQRMKTFLHRSYKGAGIHRLGRGKYRGAIINFDDHPDIPQQSEFEVE